jgi:hypothetical protein
VAASANARSIAVAASASLVENVVRPAPLRSVTRPPVSSTHSAPGTIDRTVSTPLVLL